MDQDDNLGKQVQEKEALSTTLSGVASASIAAPPIPHITTNIVPLSTILKNYSEHSYKELTQLLITLQSTTTSDLVKKKKLLELLVKFRENFIRLYVLTKWSRYAENFTKLIDLLNWLRMIIESISSNPIWGLKNLSNSLTSAKLPNPDLITALEVLVKGRPQLPSYNFIKQDSLSASTILKTLKNLNVILSLRLSLIQSLPKKFYNYTVKDGRCYFNIPKGFQCCVSLANDDVNNSQFFLIDFKFNFIFKDNIIVYNDEITKLPTVTHERVENLSNQLLQANRLNSSGGLNELYKFLHNFTLNYKLYLIHRQLILMRIGYWKSQINHTYNADKNIIIINYWVKSTQKKNAKSYFELSVLNDELVLKWIKDGILIETIQTFEDENEFCIEKIVTKFTEEHVKKLMFSIYDELLVLTNDNTNKVQIKETDNTPQLMLELLSMKFTTFSISPLSGLIYFINPSPLVASFVTLLNQDLQENLNKLAIRLLSLSLETRVERLNSMMSSTGWFQSKIVKLSGEEESKLTSTKLLNSIQYFKRKDWPQGWFLVASINVNTTDNLNWFVCRIKSYLGNWSIQWYEKLDILSLLKNTNDTADGLVDHDTLSALAELSTSKLLSHIIVEELENSGAKLKMINSNIKKGILDLFMEDGNLDSKEPFLIVENGSFFKIPNASSSIFIKIKLLSSNNLKIVIYGRLKNFKMNSLNETIQERNQNDDDMISEENSQQDDQEQASLNYDSSTSIFKIISIVNGNFITSNNVNSINAINNIPNVMSSINNNRKNTHNNVGNNSNRNIVNNHNVNNNKVLKNSLRLISRFSKIVTLIQNISTEESVKIIRNTLKTIEFQYGGDDQKTAPQTATLSILDPINKSGSKRSFAPKFSSLASNFELKLSESNPHQISLLQLTNLMNKVGILPMLKVLKLTLPIVESLSCLNKFKDDMVFINEDDTLKKFPVLTFRPLCYESNLFNILYNVMKPSEPTKRKAKKSTGNNMENQKTYEKLSFSLTIELKNSRNKDIIYLHSQTSATSSLQYQPQILKDIFSGKIKFPNSIPLDSGIACEYKNCYDLINWIHDKICTYYLGLKDEDTINSTGTVAIGNSNNHDQSSINNNGIKV